MFLKHYRSFFRDELFAVSSQYAQNVSSNIISLAEHLGTRISDHIPETPNRLSEDMIKCISTIYSKLTEPSSLNLGLSSPVSSLSSASAFSPGEQSAMCSPGFRNNSSFDVRLDNPFLIEGLKEFSGPYSTMIEISWICGDPQKLCHVKSLLENFRSPYAIFRNYHHKSFLGLFSVIVL